MTHLFDIVAAYGVCFGLQNDKAPFLPGLIRKDGNFFDRMFSCSYCTGFHAGWIVWVGRGLVDGFPTLPALAPSVLLFAFVSAATCYSVDVLLQWVESHIPAGK